MLRFRTALLTAVLAFILLFALRLGYLIWIGTQTDTSPGYAQVGESFENTRKNYASLKKAAQGQPLGDTQKFEKIATLTQVTQAFDADRKRALELIAGAGAVIQLERSQGLKGRRSLNLGIGVPPDKFDGFLDKARAIGRLTHLEVVKNDKTNEYLQLRAKRATLEKTRAALEKLQQPGIKTEESLNILNRMTEVEQQIQDLGVSLGDYDAANELCTVKLTLGEVKGDSRPATARLLLVYAVGALAWTIPLYLMGGIGLFALAFAFWLVPVAWRMISVLSRNAGASGPP